MSSPAASAPWAVRVDNVNHHFGDGETRTQVLFDNTLHVEPGKLVIMTGPSGSGKSTLLTLIGALRTVQDGELTLLGRSLHGLGPKDLMMVRRGIGFIFQMHNLFDALSAYENVRMAMELVDTPPGEMRKRGTEILERLGLGQRMDYKPKALSGGQRQRVAVARALVNRPKLILADEPTAALDKDSSHVVMALLRELADEGSTILMVTHDNRILDAADRIVSMVDGRISSDVDLRESLVICEFLHSIEMFRHLTGAEVTFVAERMRQRRCAAGQTIVRAGEEGKEFFLIRSGHVSVDLSTKGLAPVTLGPSDFFGERALITGDHRAATVVAEEDCLLYVLDEAGFKAAVEKSPKFHDQLLQIYFQRQ